MLLWLACSSTPDAPAAPVEPESFDLADCAVCGMTVGEQPAPRAQTHDRVGHQHFCSIGDLRVFLSAPSSRGAPDAIWVEALPEDFSPSDLDSSPRPWVQADDARYVVGLERQGVMGVPVLSFASEQAAGDAAARLGAHTTTWEALRETPFDKVPSAP